MGWNTPRILKAGFAAIVAAALLLMFAAVGGARTHGRAIRTIGRDSAPSITAAQHIAAALADMDAAAFDGDRARFDARCAEAASSLIAAAENITYGDAERVPIRKLAVGIGSYSALVQNARDKHDIALFRESAQYLDTELLPAAAALDRANREALDAAWSEHNSMSQRVLFLTITVGLVLGGVLIAVQVFLSQRVRRTFNAGLLGATFAAWIFVVYCGQSFNAADRDLRIAKQDAFDSISALWQTRSLAYSANADESRAALDPANTGVHRKAFAAKDRRIRESIDTEMRNITFEGEREAAEEMRETYTEFVRDRATLPRLDRAIEKTMRLNQDAFDRSVAAAFADVDRFELTAALACLGICGLAGLGLLPRIREYTR